MIDPRLAGRVALITGANNPLGIGAATAKALAAQGARIFLTSFRALSAGTPAESNETLTAGSPGQAFYAAMQQQPPELVVGDIESRGGQAYYVETDLSLPAGASALFDACEEKLGPPDIRVENVLMIGRKA